MAIQQMIRGMLQQRRLLMSGHVKKIDLIGSARRKSRGSSRRSTSPWVARTLRTLSPARCQRSHIHRPSAVFLVHGKCDLSAGRAHHRKPLQDRRTSDNGLISGGQIPFPDVGLARLVGKEGYQACILRQRWKSSIPRAIGDPLGSPCRHAAIQVEGQGPDVTPALPAGKGQSAARTRRIRPLRFRHRRSIVWGHPPPCRFAGKG